MQSVIIRISSPSRNTTSTGRLYGTGPTALVFSNMDTNDQGEWAPAVDAFSDRHMVLTYDYPEHLDDQSRVVEDAVAVVTGAGATQVILVGASRGGVASLKAAARNAGNGSVVGVVALSAPIEYEGTIFYSDDELGGITIPKLLINSEDDDGAKDTRRMFDLFRSPKEMALYPGSAHGTELFLTERESVLRKLHGFVEAVFLEGSPLLRSRECTEVLSFP